MTTAGTILKQSRLEKKKSLGQISKTTRIKEKFLQAIENEEWKTLPNLTITLGFARNFAKTVNVDPEFVSALIRRDFPQNTYKPQIINLGATQKLWTPKQTITLIIFLTLLAISFYLFRQYQTFVSPPPLEAEIKLEDNDKVIVTGKTASFATVKINDQQILVDLDGKFQLEMRKNQAGEKIEITATSRGGKTSTLTKPID